MELIVVERSFSEPVDMVELAAREHGVSWCLEQYGVTALYSLVALDGRHAACFYNAPDAEAVRSTQTTGGLPFDHIWRALHIGPEQPASSPPPGRTWVVVQRALPAPVSRSDAEAMRSAADDCNRIHGLDPRDMFVSVGGRRGVCSFFAADAESTRIAQRVNGLPMERAWAARRFPA